MSGPCALTRVESWIVTQDFEVFYGTNDCEKPVKTCPRTGWDRQVGNYLNCIHTCAQPGHSEHVALLLAKASGAELRGARLFTTGNTICRKCQEELIASGVTTFTIGRFPS